MKKVLMTIYCLICMLLPAIAFAQDKHTIYIYQDEGVSQESLNQTIPTFKQLLKQDTVKTINAQQIKQGLWTKDAALLIIPGGADLPYAKKLNGLGNKIIKQYVKDGGAFLGICAGAYYGSAYVAFDEHGPLEVLGRRELSFFKGRAIGPILAAYDYKSQSGSRAAKIHTIFSNIKQVTVFYNGGGFFKNAQQYPNTKVIAFYANNLPAIITIHYGKGIALLSGVHFEYNPNLLDRNDTYIKKIINPLNKSNDSRKMLLKQLMQTIGVI